MSFIALHLLFVTLIFGVSLPVSAAAYDPGSADCPDRNTQPGMPSAGELLFLRESTAHFESVRDGTCRTPEGWSCTVANWSRTNAALYPHCANFFMTPNGQEGPLSHLVTKAVRTDIDEKNPDSSPFTRDYPDLEAANVCPGYHDMNANDKAFFWSYFFEILAFFESGCNPTRVNRARNVPNGPAVGLYQMEERSHIRLTRPPKCRVSVAEIHTAEGNTTCATEILKTLLDSNGEVFGTSQRGSYWYALNPGTAQHPNGTHTRFKRYLSQFPLCNPTQPPEADPPEPHYVRHATGKQATRPRQRSKKH